MRVRSVTILALTGAIASGCTAGGGCADLANDIVERSEQARYPDAIKNDLRQLRDAALVFLQRGRESECASIANDMDDLLDDVTERMEAERERAQRLAYLRSAKPVTQVGGVLKVEEITGAPVLNLDDQELGAIETVALDPDTGNIAYVALATGGFIGVGEKLVAISWEDLSVTPDGEAYVIDLSRETLEKMKGFDGDRWPDQTAEPRQGGTPGAPDRARP